MNDPINWLMEQPQVTPEQIETVSQVEVLAIHDSMTWRL